MTRKQINKLAEAAGGVGAVLIDGYDYKKCIKALTAGGICKRADAEEFFHFNTARALEYIRVRRPLILDVSK